MRKLPAVLLVALVVTAMGSNRTEAQNAFILGIDSTADAGHLFNAETGALVLENFITFGGLGTGGSTPKEAIQVGNQIWVSDQLRDSIYRFSTSGAYIDTLGNTGFDNITGMELVGNSVWVANSGTNNGAPGDAILFVDPVSGAITGNVATNGTIFDFVNYNGQVLASNIDLEDLELYNTDGTFASTFHDSDGVNGIDFAQQLFVRENGNILASGFSPPSGVYEYDPAGNQLGIVAGLNFGPRAALELGNGQIMWTNGSGFFVGADNSNSVFGGSGQYLTFVNLPIPEPTGLTLMVAVAAGAIARRRAR